MNINVTGNAENGVLGPELAAGDNNLNGPFDGELAQNLEYVVWQDSATSSNAFPNAVPGDNIHETGEKIVVPVTTFATGPITGPVSKTVPLADSTTGTGPLATTTTNYLGVNWCLGTLTMNPDGSFKCDGSSPSLNIAQTDSMTADVTLSVVQSRNNGNFVCAPAAPTTGGLTVIKQVVDASTSIQAPLASQFSIHVASSSGDVAGSPQAGSVTGTTYNPLTPGTYTVSETGGPATPFGQKLTTTFSGDCNAVPTVAVTAGTTKTCTITNTYTDIPGPGPQ